MTVWSYVRMCFLDVAPGLLWMTVRGNVLPIHFANGYNKTCHSERSRRISRLLARTCSMASVDELVRGRFVILAASSIFIHGDRTPGRGQTGMSAPPRTGFLYMTV